MAKKGLLTADDDILSDNTHIEYCKQCKKCLHWGNNKDDPFSNAYDKAFCDMFPYPDEKKPQVIINNKAACDFFEERD